MAGGRVNGSKSRDHPDRRTFLRTAAGVGLFSGVGVGSSGPTTSERDNLVWEFETGGRVESSSPTVVDGTLFVGALDGTYAVDTTTGDQQWHFRSVTSDSSPTVVDGTVFVGGKDRNSLYALDAETGEEYWRFETGGDIQSSPAVVDGTVYVGSHDETLYAVDAETGEQEWEFTDPSGWVRSSPTVVNGTVYVGSIDETLYAVDAETGEQEWGFTDPSGWVQSSPTVVDNTIIVGSNDGSTYAVDAQRGTEEWSFRTDDMVYSSPTVIDETILVGSADGNLYALDWESGNRNWTFETDSAINSSPTVAGETVFVGTGRGTITENNSLYALDLDTGEKRWQFEADGPVESSPIVVDGTVFAGSRDGKIYALDTGEEMSSNGSRTRLGTLGHHDGWEYNNQTINPVRDDGFGTTTMLAIGGGTGIATLLGVYALLQRRDSSLDSSSLTAGTEESTPDTRTRHTPDSPHEHESTTPGTHLDDALEDVDTFLSDARAARDDRRYDEALRMCHEAVEAAENVRKTAESGAPDRVTEVDSRLTEAEKLREKLEAEQDVYETLTSEVDTLEDTFDTAAAALEADDSDRALGKLDEIEERIVELNQQATKRALPDVEDRLDDLEKRHDRLRERAKVVPETSSVPETIPSVERHSLNYENIEQEEIIGSGGNADVSRATTTTDDGEIEIAVKEPRVGGTLHTSTVERLLEEAETWQRLDDHDHVVSVVDYGAEPLPWIAMEYMDAGHLGECAEEMSVDQKLWTAIATTKAVRHAHRRGVAHLDLKPENILLRSVEDAWDVPKVADWGLSKHLLQHSKSVEGMSPHYAAPEQFDEEFGTADDITDIYQLGAVFYEVFTGRPPFEGQPFEVMNKIHNEEPTPPSEVVDVPPELDEILLTALAKEKSNRYETVIYLRDELQRL